MMTQRSSAFAPREHVVHALPGITIIIEKYRDTAAEVAVPVSTEAPIK